MVETVPHQAVQPSSETAKSSVCCYCYWAEIKKRGEHSAVLMQIMANNFVHFDILANYCPMNSKKYAAQFSILIKNRFQDCLKIHHLFYIFAYFTKFPANLQMECTELPSDMQLKEKFHHVFLQHFYKTYFA